MDQLIKRGSSRGPIVSFVLALLVGCAGLPLHDGKEWTPVPITDVHMVEGEWVGVVTKNTALLTEGSVRLMIRENGHYLFAGQSKSKAAVGAGLLEARDGRLIEDTDQRAMRISLYYHKGEPILAVEVTNHETEDRFRGDFTKAQ
ncbi:hypothetical protein [Nitrospira sp. BLG_2]|uniref:hypothetical protein n=1 Tax=Nitrospira sp. BLG_2 TaxID=3397507 RepID=UPI003B9A9EAD